MTESLAGLGRILVTGGNGFIGRRLVARMRSAGADVVVPARAELDMFDHQAVEEAMAAVKPDLVYHLAATGQSGPAAKGPETINRTIAMAEILAETMPAGGRLVLAGSMAEYGKSGRVAEGDRCTPRTAYGLGKLGAGLRAAMIARERGFSACNARLFGVYGPGDVASRVFPSVLAACRAGQPVALSDGLQSRDFIHVDDACAILVAIGQAGQCPETVNVGTGVAVQIRAVIERIADALGASRDLLRFGTRQRSVHDEDWIEADIALMATLTAVPPQRLNAPIQLELLSE